jgi:thiol-disulfide isomerase/thioredoxin
MLTGCDDPGVSQPPRYAAPMRSDAELSAELRRVCEQADGERPILVEFSAAWCSDCQRLQEMKQAEALAGELAQWPHTTVNVGRFDRHRDILDAMAIESIAHWSVLAPGSCRDPIEQWTRIADRTLEVSSGEARSLTPADLARWLRRLRTS